MKLAGESHQRHGHPKGPIMMLGASAEQPARRLGEEQDPIVEEQHLQPKDANESGASE